MKQKSKPLPSILKHQTTRIARWHFLYIFAFVVSIILFDSWKLISPDDVLNRWKIAVAMLTVVTLAWYITKSSRASAKSNKLALYSIILIDIFMATNLVYAERGMASRAVMLYIIPIIVASLIGRSSAIFATATLCIAAYSYAAVRYFVVNFNEGYKIELYATIGFYSAILLIIAGLLSVVISNHKPK